MVSPLVRELWNVRIADPHVRVHVEPGSEVGYSTALHRRDPPIWIDIEIRLDTLDPTTNFSETSHCFVPFFVKAKRQSQRTCVTSALALHELLAAVSIKVINTHPI